MLFLFGSILSNLQAQPVVEQWERFDVILKADAPQNVFSNLKLMACFIQGEDTVNVHGFYDGEKRFVVRFMPHKLGLWHYSVSSNHPALDGKQGKIKCIANEHNNRGLVRRNGVHDFCYADGTLFYPVGTTAYAWAFANEGLRRMTLQSLQKAQFNKVRMCLLPKTGSEVLEPDFFPFEVKKVTIDSKGGKRYQFDYESFNPTYFQHFEQQIDSLLRLGIEADVILFHPYDKGRWGFDNMPNEVCIRYLDYVTARLSSYSNVWWSLANEYDYLKAKQESDWNLFIQRVAEQDPYHHLLSIHGSTATYFDYNNPLITHTSIQDEAPVEDFGRAATLYQIYRKPVLFDEVCYEGNLTRRWGRLSGEEMLFRMWQGLIAGTYVTHGECYHYYEPVDTLFLAVGGTFRGTSWQRIPFLRSVLTDLPHALSLADVSRDHRTATAGEGYYLIYLGKEVNQEWKFDLPAKNGVYNKLKAGTKFRVEVLDTWNGTVTACPIVFETAKENDYRLKDIENRSVELPALPFLLLRIKQIP